MDHLVSLRLGQMRVTRGWQVVEIAIEDHLPDDSFIDESALLGKFDGITLLDDWHGANLELVHDKTACHINQERSMFNLS